MCESDCHVHIKPLAYDMVTGKVHYSDPYKLERVTNLSKKRMYFKTESAYIYYVIDHIKNILMKLPDLRKAKIYIKTFDKNNIIHQFILTIYDYIADLLKMKFNMEHIIFIYIQYGNEIKFIGNV
jgi:hypothetical protein